MRQRLRHLPTVLGACALLAVCAVIVGALTHGGAGAAGAGAGVALVVVSYVFSTLAIAWAESVDPKLILPVGVGAYVTKFSLFGVGMAALSGTSWAGLTPMGLGLIAAVVTWSAALVWWTWRTRIPYVELD
jgi:membrane protease YdiL (CAAX protease family)